jgi:hypothetical protein
MRPAFALLIAALLASCVGTAREAKAPPAKNGDAAPRSAHAARVETVDYREKALGMDPPSWPVTGIAELEREARYAERYLFRFEFESRTMDEARDLANGFPASAELSAAAARRIREALKHIPSGDEKGELTSFLSALYDRLDACGYPAEKLEETWIRKRVASASGSGESVAWYRLYGIRKADFKDIVFANIDEAAKDAVAEGATKEKIDGIKKRFFDEF